MDHNMKALELDKILTMLSHEANGNDAVEACLNLSPAENFETAKRLLKETDDAYVLIAKFGAPSYYGFTNTVNALRRSSVGAVLTLRELISVDSTLKIIRGVSSWKSKSDGMETSLDRLFSELSPNKYLEQRIAETVQSEEEVADSASKALSDIRRKIRSSSQKVKEQLDKMLRSSQIQKYLQDIIVTQRDGRYVLPVKQEYRNEVKGLVHDSSGSGATLFIEPMAVVEANNEVRILKLKEAEEIERILTVLSAEIGEFADSIIKSYNSLVEINVIFAKAKLAYKLKASFPILENDGKIDIKAGRHPLIDSEKVVPTDIKLGYDFDSLIITGPNTGGKTVSIKTIGLFCLMASCGMATPCRDGSKLAFFENVLVDIGDEQSIEQSLSTFSSHMTNIIKIIEKTDENTLVLLDELGAGTDPVEGAALATAIIEALRIRKCKIAATTHYAELKEYAIKTVGVENACCEFDVETLSPTYKLLIGMPGKSNAFAISKKLGMRFDIVERAKNLVSEESSKFESLLTKLDENRRLLDKEREEGKNKKAEADKLLKEAESLREQAELEYNKSVQTAKDQAAMIVAKTRAQALAVIDEVEKIQREKNKILSAEKKLELKQGIRTLEDSSNPVISKKRDDDYKLPRALKVGDNVLIYDIDKQAVITHIKGNQISVQTGVIKTRVDISNLRLIEKKSNEKKVSNTRNVSKALNMAVASMEIDIRGMTCDEGLMELDSYLDRAIRQNLNQVTIIHGKGTGALRSAVQQHLKKHPNISSYRFGVFGEGEMGVTVAQLK